ncbi:unnamed protein product, partial [Didymodactylos carnosus]
LSCGASTNTASCTKKPNAWAEKQCYSLINLFPSNPLLPCIKSIGSTAIMAQFYSDCLETACNCQPTSICQPLSPFMAACASLNAPIPGHESVLRTRRDIAIPSGSQCSPKNCDNRLPCSSNPDCEFRLRTTIASTTTKPTTVATRSSTTLSTQKIYSTTRQTTISTVSNHPTSARLYDTSHFDNSTGKITDNYTTTVPIPSSAQCSGLVCYNFVPTCSPINSACYCFTLAQGDGFCAESDSCSVFSTCDSNNQCLSYPNTVCVINSCCGYPICYNLSYAALCPTGNDNNNQGISTITITSTSTTTTGFPTTADECSVEGDNYTSNLCDTNEVAFNNRCYYLDGTTGTCLDGYSLAPEVVLRCIASRFVGLNYKTTQSNNCCIWTSDVYENYGFNRGCNQPGPFTDPPVLGGASCLAQENHFQLQLTFCGR